MNKNNREKCISLIDFFTEEQLESVADMLESAKKLAIQAADDSFYGQMLNKYDKYLENKE